MDLKEFADRILRPSVKQAIERGTCDEVIFSAEIEEYYQDDKEILQWIEDRRRVLEKIWDEC